MIQIVLVNRVGFPLCIFWSEFDSLSDFWNKILEYFIMSSITELNVWRTNFRFSENPTTDQL